MQSSCQAPALMQHWLQVRIFKTAFPKYEKILPRRNWAEVWLKGPGGPMGRRDLVFQLRVESVPGKGASTIVPVDITIPPLDLKGGLCVQLQIVCALRVESVPGKGRIQHRPGRHYDSAPGPQRWTAAAFLQCALSCRRAAARSASQHVLSCAALLSTQGEQSTSPPAVCSHRPCVSMTPQATLMGCVLSSFCAVQRKKRSLCCRAR